MNLIHDTPSTVFHTKDDNRILHTERTLFLVRKNNLFYREKITSIYI